MCLTFQEIFNMNNPLAINMSLNIIIICQQCVGYETSKMRSMIVFKEPVCQLQEHET